MRTLRHQHVFCVLHPRPSVILAAVEDPLYHRDEDYYGESSHAVIHVRPTNGQLRWEEEQDCRHNHERQANQVEDPPNNPRQDEGPGREFATSL